MFEWLRKIAEDEENIDIQVAAMIIQLVLLIEERSLEYGDTIQDLCVEICAILGKIDKVTRFFNSL